MSSGMKCRLLATLLLSIKDVAVAAQGSSKESAERDPGAWLLSHSSANSAWRHFLTDAGWAAAALLALTAVAVAVGLLIRHYRQAQGARAARALLGVSGPTASSRAAQLLMGGPGDMTPEQADSSCIISNSTPSRSRTASTVDPWTGERRRSLGSSEPSLATSPVVPRIARILHPALATCCTGLLLVADLSVTASVKAKVDGIEPGEQYSGSLATLTLVPATKDAWESGAVATAILLGLLNGVWPLLQLSLLLVAWLVPGRWLRPSARGTLLRLLASMGKCSLSFPWLVTIWAGICQLKRHRPDGVSADLRLTLDSGLFTFLAAAMLTNSLGYLADRYHSRAVSSPCPRALS
ncbi:unnamed protein product, partial [Polarella glacialis]